MASSHILLTNQVKRATYQTIDRLCGRRLADRKVHGNGTKDLGDVVALLDILDDYLVVGANVAPPSCESESESPGIPVNRCISRPFGDLVPQIEGQCGGGSNLLRK